MESMNIYNNPNIQGYIYHIGSSTNLVNTMNIKYKKINDLLVSNNSSNNIVEKNILCLFYEKTENNYVTNIKNINDIKEISFDFILQKAQVDYKIVLQTEPQLNLDKYKIIETNSKINDSHTNIKIKFLKDEDDLETKFNFRTLNIIISYYSELLKDTIKYVYTINIEQTNYTIFYNFNVLNTNKVNKVSLPKQIQVNNNIYKSFTEIKDILYTIKKRDLL